MSNPGSNLLPLDLFAHRHIGPKPQEVEQMLEALDFNSLEELLGQAVPSAIRMDRPLDLSAERGEHELLEELRGIAGKNRVFRSFLGMGYSDCVTPAVILRNILEDPGWYTQYTPYQPEIAQGRLEMLLNFQTLVSDLTGLPMSNASLLDEGTAAAEAMGMSLRAKPRKSQANRFFVSRLCHPQTIAVINTRADALGVEVVVGDHESFEASEEYFGALVQYPATDGQVLDYSGFCEKAHEHGILVTAATDLLALLLLRPPGEFGADIAVGSAQRFGVPLGYGGPHAAFFATREEFGRQMPGRLVGISKDAAGRNALRLALQTREQHIRRQRATSNICTAQVLLAIISAAYAVYHGPEGLKKIAQRVHQLTIALGTGLERLGHEVQHTMVFDTLRVKPRGQTEHEILAAAWDQGLNLRGFGDGTIGISLDETVQVKDLEKILACFGNSGLDAEELLLGAESRIPESFARQTGYLENEVFHLYHSETEMLRYLTRLKNRDLSLAHSMIPLGSCTMKLNATSEMLPVTWPEFGRLHPFAPLEQAEGYAQLTSQLERWLSEITGFDAVSLQPNAGSQGEYAGLLVIREYHRSRGDENRTVCLIPTSAHGTNPASAVMAGMQVVAIQCDDQGNIDMGDLQKKAETHADRLAALMITYPSTHGVFETGIRDICAVVHQHGGQVYLDGANMNAMVGLCQPGQFGADVCHLNLHKTFCIPHGGGGPGMGPIGVKAHLAPFLPGHPFLEKTDGDQRIGPISAAPWGSASILPISWVYIQLMGATGLRQASEVAILSANYIAQRLEPHYPVLYKGKNGLVAHECIIDLRPLKKTAGIEVDDVAKRLMDYGFHAPTMSWPVAGTMMIEPTESESKAELDRFCDAMISIRDEIREIEKGAVSTTDNLLKNAPHPMDSLLQDEWSHPYTRQQAAYPLPWTRERKFWPPVSRIDNVYGDRNLVCTCPSVEAFAAGEGEE